MTGSCDDSLYLIWCHILCFINDQICLCNGTSADKIECFCTDDPSFKYFRYLVCQFVLIFIPFTLIRIQDLFQIIDDWSHKRCYFFILIPWQKTNVIVKLGIRSAYDHSPVFLCRIVINLFHSYCKRVKSLCGACHSLNDNQRCRICIGHQCFLHKILSYISRRHTIRFTLFKSQRNNFISGYSSKKCLFSRLIRC